MAQSTETLVRGVLGEIFSLGSAAGTLKMHDSLYDALPGMDSMAVMSVLALIEERLSLSMEMSDVSGSDFATLSALVEAVDRLRSQHTG